MVRSDTPDLWPSAPWPFEKEAILGFWTQATALPPLQQRNLTSQQFYPWTDALRDYNRAPHLSHTLLTLVAATAFFKTLRQT